MTTDTVKLFLVKGVAWNNYFQTTVPIEEFIAASSPDEAKQAVLRQLHERREANKHRAEELKQLDRDGKIDLDRPDPLTSLATLAIGNTLHPRDEEKWSATEVTIPGYEIHLIPKP